MSGNDDAYELDVRRAQLKSAFSNLTVTLMANCFIASSAALLIYDERGGTIIFLWLAAIICLNLFRLAYGLRAARLEAPQSDPRATLRTLTLLALLAGLSWAPLPTYFLDSVPSRTSAYIVFIMAGITTGATIQSLAYWRISVAFATPILIATILQLIRQGDTIDYVIASNVLLLMGMLIRIAVISEQQFYTNHATRLQATELASSLQQANSEVHTANETLRRLATTDPLTGLSNRSVFNQTLAGLVHGDAPVALALIDVDQFKSVNDNLGHAAGDQILCSLALCMLDHAGPGVTPTRLGGDEFAAIASGEDCASQLMQYAEALQREMGVIGTQQSQSGLSSVTLSVGICTDDGADLSASELFSEADRALYAAKAAGRNCIRAMTVSLRALPQTA